MSATEIPEAAGNVEEETASDVVENASVEETETAGVVIEVEITDDDQTDEPDEDDTAAATLPTWEGELAYENWSTSDRRLLLKNEITERELPLSLMCQTVTAEGHMGAEICGKITNVWREDRPEMGDGVVAIMGSGEFSETEMGPRAAQLVDEQVLRGVSVDIATSRRCLLDAKTLEEVPEEDASFEKYLNGEYLTGVAGEIMGATLVPFPAFAEAGMRIVNSDAAVDDSEGQHSAITASAFGTMRLIPRTITASAAGLAPLAPPKEWFEIPEPDGKFPLTVMDDGRICGHLATWDQCHHGFAGECVLARPSRSNYSFFHVGQIRTEEGEMVDVGRIVVGENASHASVDYSRVDAGKFYDKTSLVGAFVRAHDGKYGIWLSGVVRSDCPAERVRDMMANPPSGDWRWENGGLELIAALSVPVPGFPVPRYDYALTASADNLQIKTLVATGYYELDAPTYSRAEMRRKEMLLQKAKQAL